jgi:hypothetical protein
MLGWCEICISMKRPIIALLIHCRAAKSKHRSRSMDEHVTQKTSLVVGTLCIIFAILSSCTIIIVLIATERETVSIPIRENDDHDSNSDPVFIPFS